MKHVSKATSLVRRKTSELDEDELQYSESNANTHYFQLEGTTPANFGNYESLKRRQSAKNPNSEERFEESGAEPKTSKHNGGGGAIQGIINDVNFECN